jgi:hypothetical protein
VEDFFHNKMEFLDKLDTDICFVSGSKLASFCTKV